MNNDNKKFIFKSEILGQLAHWAVRLSSYVPPYLPALLEAAKKYLAENPVGSSVADLHDIMYDYTETNLYDYLHKMINTVPEIATLNLRKEEIAAGLTAEDDVIGCDSERRFRPADENSSYVDLGALARNIVNSIDREYQWNQGSNERIDNKVSEIAPSSERIFTESEISKLQSQVHEITGDGKVMQLFNSLLGVSAG